MAASDLFQCVSWRTRAIVSRSTTVRLLAGNAAGWHDVAAPLSSARSRNGAIGMSNTFSL